MAKEGIVMIVAQINENDRSLASKPKVASFGFISDKQDKDKQDKEQQGKNNKDQKNQEAQAKEQENTKEEMKKQEQEAIMQLLRMNEKEDLQKNKLKYMGGTRSGKDW
jgi:mRNA degradation ribonuclease J1/J2